MTQDTENKMTQVMSHSSHTFGFNDSAMPSFHHHSSKIIETDAKICYSSDSVVAFDADLIKPDIKCSQSSTVSSAPQHENKSSKRSTATVGTSCRKDGIQDVDVLCGRDKISHAHIGNKRFLTIIKNNREAYQNAPSRESKTRLSSQIVSTIRDRGGRFLKCDEATGEWNDVGDAAAREKVSHALRSCKDPNRPRVKKPRVVKKYEPTQRENELFEQALAYQQRIFKALMEQDGDEDDEQEAAGDDFEPIEVDLGDLADIEFWKNSTAY